MLSISTEADTADNTVVDKVVNEVNIQDTRDVRIKDSVPIAAFLLLAWWELIWVELCKSITNSAVRRPSLWVCSGLEGHLGGWAGIREGHLLVLLGSCRAGWSTGVTAFSGAWRGSRSWWAKC